MEVCVCASVCVWGGGDEGAGEREGQYQRREQHSRRLIWQAYYCTVTSCNTGHTPLLPKLRPLVPCRNRHPRVCGCVEGDGGGVTTKRGGGWGEG